MNKKKIPIKILSFILCILVLIPILSVFALADENDLSEWKLTAKIGYDGVFSDDNEITISDYLIKGHNLTVRIFYDKEKGTNTYDNAGDIKITVPCTLKSVVCSRYASSNYKNYNIVSAKNPNEELFDAEILDDGTVVVSNIKSVGSDSMQGFFDIIYDFSKCDLINNAECTIKGNINNIVTSNEVKCKTDIPMTKYSLYINASSYPCVLDKYKDTYNFIKLSPFAYSNKSGILYNQKYINFSISCTTAIVVDRYFNLQTPDSDGNYRLNITYNTDYMLIGVPKTEESTFEVTCEAYAKNSNCTYLADSTSVEYQGDTSHESSEMTLIGSCSKLIDPLMYTSTVGNFSFEQIYYTDEQVGPEEMTEEEAYGTDSSFVDANALSEDGVTISNCQYVYVPLDMTNLTLRIGVSGVALSHNGKTTLLDSSSIQFKKFEAYKIFDVSGSSSNKYSGNGKLTFKVYVKEENGKDFYLYKTFNDSSYLSSVTFPQMTAYYIDITGFENGVGYSNGIVRSWYQFRNTIDIMPTEEADVGDNYKVLGLCDIINNENGESIAVDSDSENVLSYGIDNVAAVYDSLPYLVQKKTYTPEMETGLSVSKFDTTEQTPVIYVYSRLKNFDTVPYKGFSTFRFELPDVAYKVVPNSDTASSDIYIEDGKKYVDLHYTGSWQDYDGVGAYIYMDPQTYYLNGNTYSVTVSNSDFKKPGYLYSTDTLTNTVSASVPIPSGAHEGLDAFVCQSGSFYSKDATKVNSDGNYKYQLTMGVANDISSTTMYTNLEQAYGENEHFNGTIQSIDVSRIEALGYSIKTYYSTKTDAGTLTDDPTVWTDSVTDLTTVRSLAFEILTPDGTSAATIPAGTYLSVVLNMKAPSSDTFAHSYENFYATWIKTSEPGVVQRVADSNTVEAYINTNCSVSVNVTDEDGNSLNDFGFEIYNEAGENVAAFTSGRTTYAVDKLKVGTYTVKNTSCPAAYETDEELTVTVTDDNPDGTVTFVAKASVSLPEAGASTLIILITVISALLAAYTVMRKKSKRGEVI